MIAGCKFSYHDHWAHRLCSGELCLLCHFWQALCSCAIWAHIVRSDLLVKGILPMLPNKLPIMQWTLLSVMLFSRRYFTISLVVGSIFLCELHSFFSASVAEKLMIVLFDICWNEPAIIFCTVQPNHCLAVTTFCLALCTLVKSLQVNIKHNQHKKEILQPEKNVVVAKELL